jgi:geranylgeranyl reductase family protein
MHDVLVVGGGPAGCYTASLLAKEGFDVHVLEEHSVIGEPVDCSGVIGAESFETLGLPESLKLAEISALTLVSPSELEVHFSPPSPLAYVIDRAAFDRSIADRTMASGASVHLGSHVVDLRVQSDGVEVAYTQVLNGRSTSDMERKTLRGGMVILAGGPRYGLQKKLKMGYPADFLKTAQTELPAQGIAGAKVFLGSRVAPGSFAWIIPFRRGSQQFARIGVSAKVNAVPFLNSLLLQLYRAGHVPSPDAPVRSWVIPISPLERTYSERVLAVGDAAGQTKPTTGGGIFYGLLCAEAAVQTAERAFKTADFTAGSMRTYEEIWRGKLGREMRTGTFFRRLAERLTDKEIDDLFRVVQSDGILSAITKKARFDWHKDVIYFALRHTSLGRIFLKGLFR